MTCCLLVIGFILTAGITTQINCSIKNYQCSKCATLVKFERTPSTLNCRACGGGTTVPNASGRTSMETESPNRNTL